MTSSTSAFTLPKWYCAFNLLFGKAVFNGVRQLGNTALINGIGTSNMSLGAIVMFTALLLVWRNMWEIHATLIREGTCVTSDEYISEQDDAFLEQHGYSSV